MKKMIREKIDSHSVYFLHGTLEEILQKLEQYKSRINVQFKVDCDHYDNTCEITVTAEREETDQEYENRLALLKKQKEKAEKNRKLLAEQREIAKQISEELERAQYLRLKEKYEKS